MVARAGPTRRSNLLCDSLFLRIGLHLFVGFGLFDDDFLLLLLAGANASDEAEVSLDLFEVTLFLELTTLLQPESESENTRKNRESVIFPNSFPLSQKKDSLGRKS